jgi:pyridoxamine 5'-phosphate oxidase
MTAEFSALTKASVDSSPIRQFQKWIDEVRASGVSEQDAISVALATSGKDCQPSARIVLLKSFDDRGFVFFTNYESRKGKELAENPKASMLFYWSTLWRQVRIEGVVERIPASKSEEYFQSRPLGSRVGAWASNQSSVIENREALENRFNEMQKRFGESVARPEHWGGYRLTPGSIEFWQGRDNRLHDRLRYQLSDQGSWKIERLAP